LARLRPLALLALVALPLLPLTGQQPSRPDPVPLRRVQIPLDRLAAELERAQKGILVQMPQTEFEAKVQRAAEAADLALQQPRLLEARYQARLDGAALVGSGRWVVANPLPRPGVLPLPELNLALRECTWDGRPALVADFDGKSA